MLLCGTPLDRTQESDTEESNIGQREEHMASHQRVRERNSKCGLSINQACGPSFEKASDKNIGARTEARCHVIAPHTWDARKV